MQTLETMKSKSQERFNHLVDLGKEQPPAVKTWGVTAGAAVAGGLVMAAGAQGLLAIFATLAALPVALTVGAIGGGLLGWRYMEQQKAANKATAVAETPFSAPAPAAAAAAVAAPEASSEPPVGSEAAVGASDSVIPSRASEPLIITPETVTTVTETVDIMVAAPPAQQDKLEDIVGVGPVFAARLQASGIYTFAQLAALNPEQLLEIMAPSRGGHLIDAAAWIEQAHQWSTSATT